MTENNDDSFNSSKAEVFEALGHPTRIRILRELAVKPLTYSELKRAAGMESNGLLTFHLGKMRDLVRLNPEGSYALTDEGREALQIVEASRNQSEGSSFQRPSTRIPHLNAILAGLVVVLIVLAAASALEYNQIQGLDSRTTTPLVTTTTTTTTTMTQIITQGQLCDLGGSIANSPSAHDTNCQESLTLSLGMGNTTVPSGTNLTISLSLQNNLNVPRQLNTTGYPLLPYGANANNGGYYYYTIPNIPFCGLSPLDAPVPAFVMIYNSSGDPLLLNDPTSGIPIHFSVSITNTTAGTTETVLLCVSIGAPVYDFAASQALSTTLNIGGYWTAPQQTTALAPIASFQHFRPGHYTLVAFDAFGDSVVLPFTVTASPSG